MKRMVRFLAIWCGMWAFAWLFWTAAFSDWGIYLFLGLVAIASGFGAWEMSKSNAPADLPAVAGMVRRDVGRKGDA